MSSTIIEYKCSIILYAAAMLHTHTLETAHKHYSGLAIRIPVLAGKCTRNFMFFFCVACFCILVDDTRGFQGFLGVFFFVKIGFSYLYVFLRSLLL